MSNKNKKIFTSLVKNYIIFSLLLLVLFIITLAFTAWQLSTSVEKGYLPKIMASDVARADYENMDIKDIEKLQGWVEILDEKLNVVYVKGNKLDKNFSYSQDEIFDSLNMKENTKYFSLIQSFKSIDGKKLYCYVKFPGDKFNVKINIKNIPYSVGKMFYNTIFKAILFFVFLFTLNITLYSLFTSRKISNPLKKITQGISKMTDGDYNVRLEFKAEKEFAIIRDSFNYMVEKLQKNMEEKRKLEESKMMMLTDLSHDIKTPITTIQGYSRALSEGIVSDDKIQKYYNAIYKKSIKVNNLINDLFDYVKLESSDYNPIMESHDFAEFIREIVAANYEDIEEKGFELQVKIPEDEIMMDFDPVLMERAISNIISNALKYNPIGTKLRIEVLHGDDSVILEIADNGVGIPDRVKERIFNAFVRGDESRKSDGGTGLGLAISKKIIEKHGGNLKLISSSLESTIFLIQI